MTIRTRMQSLWALLVGHDASEDERQEAAAIRAQKLAELQEAMKRRDTRRQNKAHKDAVKATNALLMAEGFGGLK